MTKFNHKTAVVLLNLGGPDKIESVEPFLFNLFNDKAIISLPQPLRFLVAKLISSRRKNKAQNIYKQIGGKSPLLDITLSQADSLERELSFDGNYKVFTIMRYWHPFSKEVVEKIKEYQPDQIILLPLYPQFSSTTTASSVKDFADNFFAESVPIKIVCCYPNQDDFIKSHALHINQALNKIEDKNLSKVRLLFSAHGLPQKVIDNGDPYVFQVEETAKKTFEFLKILRKSENLDLEYRICYQSKVGPLKWTTPSLEQEVSRVALDEKIPVIIPIAFVSDHSETLVELDIEYLEFAKKLGVAEYYRVPSLNIERNFIQGLSNIVKSTSKNDNYAIFCGENPQRICPKKFKLCPNPNFQNNSCES
jgi:ferrochelatase